MRKREAAWGTTFLFAAATMAAAARGLNPKTTETADNLFQAGQFAEAERLLAQVLREDPKNFHATLRLGNIALLGNRLSDAEQRLSRAMGLEPDATPAKTLLAEAFYRRDDFQKAARILRLAGKDVVAQKLESFKGVTPYAIAGPGQATLLKFVSTDPLPVVQVRVNDSNLVNFLIDTGGAEVILDAEFASQVGALRFGTETGTFGGGLQGAVQHARVDSVTLGDFTVRHIPVHLLDNRRFSIGGRRIDGIIGTVLLYHFLATLDYPNGQLVLRLKTPANLKRLEREARDEQHVVIPFWMAGDHYMVARGAVNNSKPLLFFVDTGLAGNGFTCPESTLREAGITLQERNAREGKGGGGTFKIVPFEVDSLSLGGATERQVPGVLGPFPAVLENSFGFRIAGLISHQFFRSYVLTLDFTGMRLFLRKRSGTPDPR